MSCLLLCIAMPAEAELLVPRLRQAQPVGGRPVYSGELGGRPARLILTGMGIANMAASLAVALELLPEVAAVVNLGCSGAYAGSGLALGDAALATEAIYADHGIAAGDRLHGLEKTGIPLLHVPEGEPLYHRFPCDAALSDSLAGPGLARGAFATVVRVSGDARAAARVAGRWQVILEDMESAAAAQVAAWYHKPFASLRGVSNLAGARELDVAAGAGAAQRALLRALGAE